MSAMGSKADQAASVCNGWKADVVFADDYDRLNAMEDTRLELHVRAAGAKDAAAIDRLIFYLDSLHAEARPDLFQVPSGTPRGNDFLRTVLDDPEQQILVAIQASEVIGYAHVLIKKMAGSSYRLERHYSEIDTISVDPAAQRLGVSRKLIDAATSWAESRGISDHQIAVHEFNGTARAVYEQLGFAPSVTVLRRKG
jgi:GNAT superfamily N-acetyltransferase